MRPAPKATTAPWQERPHVERRRRYLEQSGLPPDAPEEEPPEPGSWKRPARVQAILNRVALECGLSVAEMLTRRQHAPLVSARRRAARRMRTELRLSLQAIGRMLGGLNHTTVRAYCQSIDRKVGYDFSAPDESGWWAI